MIKPKVGETYMIKMDSYPGYYLIDIEEPPVDYGKIEEDRIYGKAYIPNTLHKGSCGTFPIKEMIRVNK